MKNGLDIDIDGNRFWYKDNKFHREDGPAIELSSGYKAWYINHQRHRENGPAIEGHFFDKKSWYYHGEKIYCKSQEEFERIIKIKAFI